MSYGQAVLRGAGWGARAGAFGGPWGAAAGAVVGGLVGAGIVWMGGRAVDQAIEDADAAANAGLRDSAATEACSDCPPDDRCRQLAAAIKARRDELAQRYAEMRADRFGLYGAGRAGRPGIGSWHGHVEQFQGKQANLRRLLREAEQAGCGPQGDAWQWATREPPARPAP
jgi:erythromycin esterase-like protein